MVEELMKTYSADQYKRRRNAEENMAYVDGD